MYSLTEGLGVDDLLQQGDDALAVGWAHTLGQLFLVLLGDLATPLEAALAGRGEVEGADPAVVGVRAALDEAALLEFVDQGDHPTGGDFDRRADRLLGLSLGCGDQV